MAQNIGEFKTLLRRAHKRGSALDVELDGAMRRAANWVEANHTLQYMRRRFTLDVEKDSDEAELPSISVKAVLSLRYLTVRDDFGRPISVRKVTLEEMDFDDVVVPNQFYLDGVTNLVFNGAFGENYQMAGMLARYSDWPKADTDTHWLILRAESLMLSLSMMELGLISRDERSYSMFQSNLSSQITVLQNADYEAVYAGQDISL